MVTWADAGVNCLGKLCEVAVVASNVSDPQTLGGFGHEIPSIRISVLSGSEP